MSREDERQLSTADFALAGERRAEAATTPPRESEWSEARRDAPLSGQELSGQELAALFQGPVADDFRRRWDAIQIGFVDDPRRAVQSADELVAQVMKTLAETFADQRAGIEAGIGREGQEDTERLRIALQRYRSFFQRLLSL